MNGLDIVLGIIGFAFVSGMLRAFVGPTLADRAAATDVCLFCLVATMAVLAVRLDEPLFLDAVVVATLLGFVATVSLARLVGRKRP